MANPLEKYQIAALKRKSFEETLAHAAKVSQARIGFALTGLEGDVADAMIYACSGGKALRAFLVLETTRMLGINPVAAAGPAVDRNHLSTYH